MIEFQLDRMREEYEKEINNLKMEEKLYYHFSYTKKNADYFIALYNNGMAQLAYDKFCGIRSVTMPIWSENPVEQEYRCEYIVAGIEAVQRIWIARGCRESVDEVVEIALKAQEKQIPIK